MGGLENMNILSVGGFIFFLLIFLVGYIFVEIIFGDRYFFRKSIEKYQNNLFDRVVHYISWGIVLNILYIFLLHYVDRFKNLSDIFNISGKVGNVFSFLGEPTNIQIILFGIYYFIGFIIILFSFKLIFFILDKISGKVESCFKSKNNSNWIKIKKVFIRNK